MDMQDLILYGAGGLAKEVTTLVREINEKKEVFRLIAYALDDEWYHEGMKLRGLPVISRKSLIEHKDDVVCACAIGYPKDRRRVQESLKQEGVRFTNLLHPTTRMGEEVIMGEGCIVQPYSSVMDDCKLGDGIFLNGYVTLGHETVVEDYVTCFPRSQISGQVKIGEAACIGTMSFINEKRKIGAEAVIAPGSIVFGNVKEGSHVMGNPAKRIEL